MKRLLPFFAVFVLCAQTLCRFEILHEDPDAHLAVFRQVRSGEHQALSGPTNVHREASPPNGFRSTFYVARGGMQLPTPAQ